MNIKEEYKHNFLKKDILLIYKNKYDLSMKIEYDCFDKKNIDNNCKALLDNMYKNYKIPKDYIGLIASFKKNIDKGVFYYEYASINKGKIRAYKYEIYELKEKYKLFNRIYEDIKEIFINKFAIKDDKKDIKYKSFYKKDNYGELVVNLSLNKIIFKNNKNAIDIQKFIKSILNYKGFLMKVQFIK